MDAKNLGSLTFSSVVKFCSKKKNVSLLDRKDFSLVMIKANNI